MRPSPSQQLQEDEVRISQRTFSAFDIEVGESGRWDALDGGILIVTSTMYSLLAPLAVLGWLLGDPWRYGQADPARGRRSS